MEVVQLKNNLLTDFRKSEIKTAIVNQLTEKALIDKKYTNDTQFLEYLTNLIEFLVKKDDKINKKDLALEIFKTLFGATEEELDLIGRNVEYLHSNKVIKKVSIWKLFKCGIKEWLGLNKKKA
jgi:hypothetical protein